LVNVECEVRHKHNATDAVTTFIEIIQKIIFDRPQNRPLLSCNAAAHDIANVKRNGADHFLEDCSGARRFCSTDTKWVPLRTDLIFGKRKKSQ